MASRGGVVHATFKGKDSLTRTVFDLLDWIDTVCFGDRERTTSSGKDSEREAGFELSQWIEINLSIEEAQPFSVSVDCASSSSWLVSLELHSSTLLNDCTGLWLTMPEKNMMYLIIL